MNTPKIAALYASPIFNTLLRFPAYDTTTTLTKQVMQHVLREARVVSEDGRRYRFSASYPYRRDRQMDDLGYQTHNFFEEQTTKRVADWMLSQLPGWPTTEVTHLRKGIPEASTLVVDVVGYGQRDDNNPANDIDNRGGIRYGAREDFELILRGMASIRRKRRKQAKKLEAQLHAYHAQQELAKLQKGQWLGAEKALTTAARVDEPGVPFLGDSSLSNEQRQALRYWAVPESAGMSAAFPAGTGIALKVITSGKQLVDGAVYLSQLTFGKPGEAHYSNVMRLGRLHLAKKSYGNIPLFEDDAPGKQLHITAEWKHKEGQGYEVLLMQVTHYTTRNAAPATSRLLPNAEFGALNQEQQQAQGEELAYAA